MQKYNTLIVGAGASGIVAAISAKRSGKSVLLCEQLPHIGKKILASGSGRCNLSNQNLDLSFYNLPARPLVASVFARFPKDNILSFFKELGLLINDEEERIFPQTNQSASVLKVLELELKRLKIPIEFHFRVSAIHDAHKGFVVSSKGNKRIECEQLIIAGGGKSYPTLGSSGSCYPFAEHFGHTIVTPVPVVVPLLVKDPLCHALQGQKITADAKAIIDGKVVARACDDVLFTTYGLTGTAIIDISPDISIAMNRLHKKGIEVSIDFIPFLHADDLRVELRQRIDKKMAWEDILIGILPNKFTPAFMNVLTTKDIDTIVATLKDRRFKVVGTKGWDEAEFTAGGIDAREIKEGTLESKLRAHLYFCGEIIDVNGKRGGYNLAWAWASGFVAGLTN